MNRYDPNASRQQAGSYSGTHGYDSPRQANQWQTDQGGQAGGGWGYDDGQTMYRRDERIGTSPNDSDMRSAFGDEDREGPGYEREYLRNPRAGRERGGSRPYRSRFADRYYDAGYPADYSPFTSEDYGGRDFSARGNWAGRGISSSDTYRPSFGLGRGDWTGFGDYGNWRDYGERRGFFERAGDEIASWFGDEDAARRRDMDHRGRGPSDYTRSDERIREDVNDSLTHDWRLDASQIRVTVQDGEVTLNGTVDSRADKRRAEDITDDVSGVRHVQNNLRVQDAAMKNAATASTTGAATTKSTAGKMG